MYLCFLSEFNLSSPGPVQMTVDVGPFGMACLGITDLNAGGGGLELYEAEAPVPDDRAVLEIVRHGLVGEAKFGPSTKSTAPNRRFVSWRLKWPESSGKRLGYPALLLAILQMDQPICC